MSGHTPTPWYIHAADEKEIIVSRKMVASTGATEDAAFIVRACNAHEGMLSALRMVLISGSVLKEGDIAKRIEAAIAKAEGRAS